MIFSNLFNIFIINNIYVLSSEIIETVSLIQVISQRRVSMTSITNEKLIFIPFLLHSYMRNMNYVKRKCCYYDYFDTDYYIFII